MLQAGRYFLVFIALLPVSSCQTLPEGVTPHYATWLYGEHKLPATATLSGSTEIYTPRLDKIREQKETREILKPGVKIPAAIYMHGCAGISSEAYAYQDLMLSQGYAFFMPDSFARPGRVKLCGQGGMSARVDMRQREVDAALKAIRQLPWIDQKRLVLMGFSEGGNTTDSWYSDDFAGLIVLGSACTNSGGSPSAPERVPVLAIVGEIDEYRPGMSCTITRTVGGSKSIVIPRANHWISHHDETQDAIREFLGQCCL
jgi:dienelactone hydrolase